jgi:hypothetical protein
MESGAMKLTPDLPCEIYYDWRDPDVSEEDHAKGIQNRTKRLKE